MEQQQHIRREDTGPVTELICCKSCGEWRGTSEPWYCDDCLEIDQRRKEEKDRSKEELEVKIAFLTVTDQHQLFSDVELIVEDGSEGNPLAPIRTYKFILVKQSPVFKAMFENPMEERQSGKIIIKDASYQAVKYFVNFLGSAEVSLDDDQLALELLGLGERYQVMLLKNHCENFMVSKLTWENSILSYKFAYMHNAKLLLEEAASLITNNLAGLMEHPDYRPLADENPTLTLKLMEACLLAKEERNSAVSTSG